MNSKRVCTTALSIAASLAMALVLTACATQVGRSDQPRPTPDTVAGTGEKMSIPVARSDQPRLTPDASAKEYEEMVRRIVAYIKEHGSMTVAQVRDEFNTSRKYALAIMERLDEQKMTRRVGAERVLR